MVEGRKCPNCKVVWYSADSVHDWICDECGTKIPSNTYNLRGGNMDNRGKLRYFYGTMGAGKSTLALQMNHNFKQGNKNGFMVTMKDRSGEGKITSRIGAKHSAEIINEDTNLFTFLEDKIISKSIDYIICDELQFYTKEQIDQLGNVVDFYGVDIYCFGITTDFKGELFDASKRLFEIADYKFEIEVKTLCWCGKKAIMHGRTINGELTYEGEQKVVGDVNVDEGYEALCRKHFFSGLTKKKARERGLI